MDLGVERFDRGESGILSLPLGKLPIPEKKSEKKKKGLCW